MIILGIDPGIAIVGWGVIRFENSKATALDYGSVMTGPEFSVEERLEIIYDRLDSIIKKYRPDAVSVEELFWNTNQKNCGGSTRNDTSLRPEKRDRII